MGLFKRGKVWWMRFTYEGQQIRRSTETTDRRLAEAILGKVRVKIVEGRFFEVLKEKERTFGEMMQRYLQERSILKAPTSRLRDKQNLQHLLPIFGDLRLAEVTSKLLASYKATRREEGAAPATINKEIGLVRHAFNVAIREWEWCRENPMQRVEMEKVHNARDRWLMVKEEERLLRAAPAWLQEMILFALHTGMRRGEILSLQWQDVDLVRGVLVVMKSKNRERRTIPLNARVFELLVSKESRSDQRGGFVFTTSCGTKIGERNLMRAYYAALEKAGIENFTFHDLRHTFATRMVQRGIDLYKVQRLLGHKTPAMSQRYAHHSPESLRDGVAVLEEAKVSTGGPSVSTKLAHSESPTMEPLCN